MDPKRLLLLCWVAWRLTACVSSSITWDANADMKKVAIGITEEQVISILGPNYLAASSAKDAYGRAIDVLAYKSDVDEEYRLTFVNAQLREWNREHIRKYSVKDLSTS